MVDRNTADRVGIEANPLNDACLGLSGEYHTNLGNLLSHCLEAIGSKDWAPNVVTRVLPELMGERDRIVDDAFLRSEAYRAQSSDTKLDRQSEAYRTFAAGFSQTKLEFHVEIRFTNAAVNLAFKYLEEFYQPIIKDIEVAISATLSRMFSGSDTVTYESLWNGLKTFVAEMRDNTREVFLLELHSALTNEPIDSSEEIDNPTVSPERSESVLQGANLFTQHLRRQWNKEQQIIGEQIRRGICVTEPARRELLEQLKLAAI